MKRGGGRSTIVEPETPMAGGGAANLMGVMSTVQKLRMRKAETTGIPGQVEIDEDTTLDVKKIEEAERGWINKCKADPRYGQVNKKMLEKIEDKLGDDYRMHSFEITQAFDAMALTGIRLMYDRIKEDQYTIQELTKQRDTFKTRLMEAQTEQLREVSELRSKIRTLQNKEEFNPEDYDEPPMWYEACNYLDEGEQELVQLIVIEKVKLALSKGEGTRMILENEAAKRKVLEDRIAELEGELEALQQLYDTMKQDLEKQRAQFEENIKELQAKLEAAGISDGTPEPTRDRSGAKELMMLKEENANLKEEIKDLKAQIRELEAMRKKLQGELDRLKTGGAPGDHDSDAASRARTPKEEELGKRVRELEAEIARLKKMLEQMEKRAKDAESKLSAMEREFAKLQTQMKSLRDAIARGETPPADAMDAGPVVSAGTDFPDQSELVENLRKENADLKAELEKMRMKMKQLEDEFAEKVAALKAQIAGLENQLEEASAGGGADGRGRSRTPGDDSRLKDLQKQLEDALAESESRKVIIEGLMVRLKELEDLLRKLGYGDKVDKIMGNAFRHLLASSGFASVFERLYQDALNRIKRIGELRARIQKMENADWQQKMGHVLGLAQDLIPGRFFDLAAFDGAHDGDGMSTRATSPNQSRSPRVKGPQGSQSQSRMFASAMSWQNASLGASSVRSAYEDPATELHAIVRPLPNWIGTKAQSTKYVGPEMHFGSAKAFQHQFIQSQRDPSPEPVLFPPAEFGDASQDSLLSDTAPTPKRRDKPSPKPRPGPDTGVVLSSARLSLHASPPQGTVRPGLSATASSASLAPAALSSPQSLPSPAEGGPRRNSGPGRTRRLVTDSSTGGKTPLHQIDMSETLGHTVLQPLIAVRPLESSFHSRPPPPAAEVEAGRGRSQSPRRGPTVHGGPPGDQSVNRAHLDLGLPAASATAPHGFVAVMRPTDGADRRAEDRLGATRARPVSPHYVSDRASYSEHPVQRPPPRPAPRLGTSSRDQSPANLPHGHGGSSAKLAGSVSLPLLAVEHIRTDTLQRPTYQ